MNDESFPKFQYSVFTKNGHDGQYVIRTNDKDEFVMLIEYVNSLLPKTAVVDAPTAFAKSLEGTTDIAHPPLCGIHGTSMTWRTGVSQKTNKPYAFWACPTKNADGSFCTFKAPK